MPAVKEWADAHLNRTRALLGAGAVVTLLALAWFALGRDAGDTAAAEERPAAELAPLPWESGERPEAYDVPAEPEVITAKEHGVEAMPPASAGSNGSYTPRPAHERERLQALTHPAAGSPEDAALLLGDSAIPPSHAPPEIQAAIDAANQITDQPYRWGGGHAGWRSRGYDCSGAVSYALAGGGLIGRPATSGELMGWGSPGRGRWLTIYANPGHTYAVIAGLRFDTVGLGRGVGPRWHPADAYPDGYVARHVPGL